MLLESSYGYSKHITCFTIKHNSEHLDELPIDHLTLFIMLQIKTVSQSVFTLQK